MKTTLKITDLTISGTFEQSVERDGVLGPAIETSATLTLVESIISRVLAARQTPSAASTTTPPPDEVRPTPT